MSGALSDRALDAFSRAFGGAPDFVARAPGRVNLIGEHTDYNEDIVLPLAISVETRIAARARRDGVVRLAAADYGGALDEFRLAAPIDSSAHLWANYVRGVIDGMRRAGFDFTGADLAIAGDIPQGAGLSSSASLEVATAVAVARLAGDAAPDMTALARIAQAAECDFVGCKCGIMDQLVSACGVEGAALLIDCRSLAFRPVLVPEDLAIMIVHSGVIHGHVEGEYNERRRQCEEAASALGVAKLREADEAILARGERRLDPTAFRRARHVITENRRTFEAAEALAKNSLRRLGRLMRESHQSMRDDFEITTPDIDRLAALMNAVLGENGGARMTGGGFGGAVVAIAPRPTVANLAREVSAGYRRPDGKPTEVIIQRPAAGGSCV
ncbi:MAG TPA: galactokinase [Parvularcula sp.]|nr:galactokinase [Parvularcula sp.]